jgi:glycogen debranching enzyme
MLMTSSPFGDDGSAEVNWLWGMAFSALQDLRTEYGFNASDAAGLYPALFGRDSLWILLMLLEARRLHRAPEFGAWVEKAGEDVLRALCSTQSDHTDDTVDAQPGRIIHEVQLRPTPHSKRSGMRYDDLGRLFSGFDQTFLFITAFRRFADAFPENPISEQGWPNVTRAIHWIERFADEDGDGLFEYSRRDPHNLLNQTWKDSFDSVSHAGIAPPPPPLAWIDVQGYAYQALGDAADLCAQHGDDDRARSLAAWAQNLKRDVDLHYWIEDAQCYAMALDRAKRAVRVVSSNPGHALWAGLVEEHRAAPLAERLLQHDMLTTYGVRTLSSGSVLYAPFAYHRGTIWPFDNAVLVAGLLRYGFAEAAEKVIEAVVRAIRLIRTPIELYTVIDSNLLVDAPRTREQFLMHRRYPPENQVQGFSAAGLLLFAALLPPTRTATITGKNILLINRRGQRPSCFRLSILSCRW